MRAYPRVRTVRPHGDPVVEVIYTEGAAPRLFCGAGWCSGECGLPALVTRGPHGECRAVGDHVAIGAFMQLWRVAWNGDKIEVPEEHREHFLRSMWW